MRELKKKRLDLKKGKRVKWSEDEIVRPLNTIYTSKYIDKIDKMKKTYTE